MARCKLDLEHPKFRRSSDAALQVGLGKLREMVARDHKLSGWVPHPMPRYQEHQNKIWKWDFKPEGDRSGTRKGWRLYAYVPDPKAPEPIPATAFLCYDKSDAPGGDHVKFLHGILKKFLSETIAITVTEDRFRRQLNGHGETVSLCYECCEIVAISAEFADIEIAEGTHQCAIGEIAASGT